MRSAPKNRIHLHRIFKMLFPSNTKRYFSTTAKFFDPVISHLHLFTPSPFIPHSPLTSSHPSPERTSARILTHFRALPSPDEWYRSRTITNTKPPFFQTQHSRCVKSISPSHPHPSAQINSCARFFQSTDFDNSRDHSHHPLPTAHRPLTTDH